VALGRQTPPLVTMRRTSGAVVRCGHLTSRCRAFTHASSRSGDIQHHLSCCWQPDRPVQYGALDPQTMPAGLVPDSKQVGGGCASRKFSAHSRNPHQQVSQSLGRFFHLEIFSRVARDCIALSQEKTEEALTSPARTQKMPCAALIWLPLIPDESHIISATKASSWIRCIVDV